MRLARLLFLLCLLTFLCTSVSAQCPAGNVVLETDAEVATFFAAYPNCTEFNADLNIQSNVTDLIPFKDVVYVKGNLTIRSTPIDNLEGLAQLQKVDGSFGLSSLPFTNDLATVPLALETVGGGLTINNNTGLQTIDQLQNLEDSDAVTITGNPALKNLDGLQTVTIASALTITNNAVLSDCDASGICSAITAPVASLTISGNDGDCANFFIAEATCLGNPACPTNLTLTSNQDISDFIAAYPNCVNLPGNLLMTGTANNLQALDLETVGGNAEYIDITSLVDINGFGLTSVGGDLIFQRLFNLKKTMADGFRPLETVGGTLRLASLYLVDYVPFDKVTSLGGLSISFNNNQLDLSAMDGAELSGNLTLGSLVNIESLGFLDGLDIDGRSFDNIVIVNNTLLSDISEIENVIPTGTFAIQNNPALSDCHIESVCLAIANPVSLFNVSNNDTGCSTLAEIKPSCFPDLGPLLAIYNAAGGPDWTDNTGWAAAAAGTNCTPCDGTWFGIACQDGRVTDIQFSGDNNLIGTIAPEIGQLSALKRLSISLNPGLTGPIPSSLFDLPELMGVGLFTNNLSGSIPTNLGNATKLEGLNLNSNPLLSGTIPPSIVNLTELLFLGLSQNEITGRLPLGMQALTKLRSIEIASTNVNNSIPAELLTIPALESLNLSDNDMSGLLPGTFDDNGVLNRLLLNGNNFTGPFQVSIAAATSLRYLRLDDNNLAQDVTTNVANLVNLEEFNISGNNFTGPLPEPAAPGLTQYRAAGNDFSGALPVSFASLTMLTDLDVSDNDLLGCYPDEYSALCTGVTTNFSGNTGLPDGGSAAGFATEFCDNGIACPALPVNWLSFTAVPDGKSVHLQWATTGEVNNEKFLVERSGNGRDWTAVETLSAANQPGNSYYETFDNSPLTGVNYYRIRQVDYDGSFSFSTVQAVTFDAGEVLAFPNPFHGSLTVYSQTAEDVSVLDASGREVTCFRHAGGGAQVQNLALKSGVYTLRMLGSGAVVRIVAQ